jgi:hypothetical protein
MVAEITAWYLEGVMFGADHGATFEPEQLCVEIEDPDTYEFSSAHCAVPEHFKGGWFQPPMADSYAANYRFGPECTGVAWCVSIGSMTITAPFALPEINGAAALSAGAAVLAAAIMY